MKVIYFDTETTGLDCSNCKIIELAMLTVENGKIVDRYDEFINVGKPLSPNIISLTGITNEMLRNEGIEEKTAAFDLKKRLTKDTLMIAHNCQFDLLFLFVVNEYDTIKVIFHHTHYFLMVYLYNVHNQMKIG